MINQNQNQNDKIDETLTGDERLRLIGIKRLYPVAPKNSSLPTEIDDAVICITNEKITWLGSKKEAPPLTNDEKIIDLNNAIVTPGWIDPHTHLIWAGSRQNEFRQRLEGKSYLDITKAGGGIMSTVRAVRASSLDKLIELARPRIQRFLSFGITTAEVKSGYGLQTNAEIRMLEAIQKLNETEPIELIPTFLGAHTIPTEHKEKREHYINEICEQMLPQVAERQLAEYCDIFIEQSAFTLEEARYILIKAIGFGLTPRIHADQLSAGGGAELAAELGAASADHLEEIGDADIQAMLDANVVACLIPGSTFSLRQQQYAPARKMLDAGLTITLATDLNPGTTCSENLALTGTLAALHMGMTPNEILHAVTRGAAISLNREKRIGSIAKGYQADITVFNAPDIDYIFYHYGVSHVQRVFKKGKIIWYNSNTTPKE